MALSLSLYSFSKRRNSTAVPSGDGTVVNVVLKRETSLNNPTFIIESDDVSSFTYARFNSAYYFIDDIRSIRNNIWEIDCTIDALATLRTNIRSTSAFVEYAAQGNSQIPDTRLGVEYGVGGVKTATADVVPGTIGGVTNGSRYVTVLGQLGCDTYWVAEQEASRLMASISQWSEDAIDRTSLETIVDTGLRQVIGSGSAAACVRDAYVLPNGPINSTLGSAQNIYLGMFNTGQPGRKVTGSGTGEKYTDIAIPHQYADWRKQAPFEVVQLFLPLYGTINIPSDIAADSDALRVACRLNVRSGDFTYIVGGSGRQANEIVVGGNCAAPLAIGSSNINVPGSFGNIAAGLTAASYGNIPGAAAASLRILSPVPQSVGATGGISNVSPLAQCIVYYRNTSEAPSAQAAAQGIPLFATRTMNTLSGYVKTKGFSVTGSSRSALKDIVNDAMDNGVFLE